MLSRQIKTHKPKYRTVHRGTTLSILRFAFRKRPKRIITHPQPPKHQGRAEPPRLCHRVATRHMRWGCTDLFTQTLVGKDFFGKYGKVSKVVINKRGSSNRKHYRDISYAAHITYEDEVSASLAVVVVWQRFRVCLNSNTTRTPSEAATATPNTVRTSSTGGIATRAIACTCITSSRIRRLLPAKAAKSKQKNKISINSSSWP